MNKNRFYFGVVTTLFFIWGFLTCMNDILIPYLKGVFQLSYAQSMLVQFAFFTAYFVGSLIYYLISSSSGDPINRIGYKNGIILGLIVSATGLCLFYPAAQYQSYGFFLSALFVLGLGFTLLQICANPYISLLGKPETASGRLNLAGGLNSLGTTIAPIIGGILIFEVFHVSSASSAEAVKVPYLAFGFITLIVAIIFGFIHLPSYANTEKIEHGFGVLQFPQLSLGVIAIFMYVGAEVAVGSMLTGYVGLPDIANLPPVRAAVYIALYWGSLMIGRFTGSAALSDMERRRKLLFSFVIPAIVFPFLVGIFYLKGFDVKEVLPYAGYIIVVALGFILSQFKPARTLMVFALINIVLLGTAIFATGKIALFNVIATGLFDSVMWPIIFTLAIHGLGKYTSQGSSLLVMGILGGAIVPWIQGYVADHAGVHVSFVVPGVCFLYLAFYGWKMRGLLASDTHVAVME
jgi:FHS family L-fucose permease-like MFS transporter